MDLCREVDRLIKSKNTGKSEDISKTLSITPALALEVIKYMKDDMGCPIHFCEYNDSYIYTKKGKFFIGFLSEK